ncbi:MAG: zinc ribbon domain-containing protein [Candidatus Levyibacteriota bacterium]
MEIICPHCKNKASDADFFCPSCGKKLKDPPLSTGIGKQISIYLIAILLPPFGLIPAVKYLKGGNQKAKMIGLTALVLTIVTILVTILLTLQVVSEANKVISSQGQSLQNLNY